MSFQYYSKSIEQLQQIALVIGNNFAELVGCKPNSKLWSPTVGYNICEALALNGTQCSNVSDKIITDVGALSFRFTSSVSVGAKNLWTEVLNYGANVLDPSYVSSLKIPSNLPQKDKLKLCIDQSTEYNCEIYKVCQKNNQIYYAEDLRRLYLILLSCFSFRYHLYNFSMGHETFLDDTAINDSILDLTIQNIQYEKHVLSQMSSSNSYEESVEHIQQQLTLLLKNCRQLKTYVLPYIR